MDGVILIRRISVINLYSNYAFEHKFTDWMPEFKFHSKTIILTSSEASKEPNNYTEEKK